LNSTNTKENACKKVKRTYLEADEGAATLLKAAGETISVVVCSSSFSPILCSSPEF
jgi:tartrate dehydratase beta subunit/fumarate hydratase class I family protein